MRDFRNLFESKLGFGLMRLPTRGSQLKIDLEELRRMVDYFLEHGGQYFDTAYVYHGGHSERAIRDILVRRAPREAFMLADKLPVWEVRKKRDMERLFTEQLSRCGVDYFDSYLLHNLDAESYEGIEKYGGFDFLRQLKQDGRARYIGFSFHHTPEVLDRILSEQPGLDFVQLQINYYDWDSPAIQSQGVYKVAKKHELPIVVMEPIKGGGLVNLPEAARQVLVRHDPSASIASHALRFAASLDQVAVVLSGMSGFDQMQDNVSTLKSLRPVESADQAALDRVVDIIREANAIACTTCLYCVDDCPKNIPIPDIFSIYNFKKQFGEDNFPPMHYMKITAGKGKASDCIQCGRCEKHCPQHLEIRQLLEQCANELEGFWG